jgi:hypothetical protein
LKIFDLDFFGEDRRALPRRPETNRKSSIFNLQSKIHEAGRKAFSDVPFQAGTEVLRLRERRKWLQP